MQSLARKSLLRCKASQGGEYDLFLSFRGLDIREGFVDFLYLSLKDAGLHVFLDNKAIRGGKTISTELIQAIRSSKILMPIFSKNYATSDSCLMELAEMVKCSRSPNGQEILAIYFDVTPSDVKLHQGPYIEALRQHRQGFDPETVHRWEKALKEVTKKKGWELEKETNGFQGQFAKFIVRKVLEQLKTRQLKVTEHLVKLDNHIRKILRLLEVGSDDVRFIVLYGMLGSGKTTLAKVIYNLHLNQFECCAFLPDIQEKSRQQGLEFLQNRLVSQLLKENSSESEAILANQGRFSAKEVLILLDDVGKVSQLDALVGKRSWFGLRSRIIITTRNKDILRFSEVDCSYELSGMGFDQSLTLFCRHAFRREYPLEEYVEYSQSAVEISGGNPLALEVIASFLSTKPREAWDRSLKMLEEVPHADIQEKFGIILKDLNNQQMQIFLDIAFYFIGVDRRIAIYMWDARSFPETAIEKLLQHLLIKIADDNKLWMHRLIRDTARQIVRPTNDRPGEQSRYCNHVEALKLLKEKKGTEAVEGLSLDVDSTYPYCLTPDEFQCVPNLRFLQLNGMKLAGNFQGLLLKLRWLKWHCCPSLVLPNYLDLPSVAVLDLSWSTMNENWEGWRLFETAVKLKVMILMGSSKLTRTPDFSAFPALKRLTLEHCEELMEFHPSLSHLKHLVYLNLRECTSIKQFPQELFSLEALEELLVDETRIREIHILPGSLKKLRTLSASGCTDLTDVHSSISSLESLLELVLDNTNITQLPGSIGSLLKLKVLSLRSCRHLSELPESIGQLELLSELAISNTGIIELPDSTSNLKCLMVRRLDDDIWSYLKTYKRRRRGQRIPNDAW